MLNLLVLIISILSDSFYFDVVMCLTNFSDIHPLTVKGKVKVPKIEALLSETGTAIEKEIETVTESEIETITVIDLMIEMEILLPLLYLRCQRLHHQV